MEPFILGAADEHQPASGHDGSAEIFGAGLGNAARGQFRTLTERDAPDELALVQINGVELAPGRLDRGITVFVQESSIAGGLVGLAAAFFLFDYPGDVRLIVRVDVENLGGRVEGSAAPVSAAVKAGNDDGAIR